MIAIRNESWLSTQKGTKKHSDQIMSLIASMTLLSV